jgi:hypothetical protein
MFMPSLRLFICVKLPRLAGMVPLSRLNEKSSKVSNDSEPTLGGIVPLNSGPDHTPMGS